MLSFTLKKETSKNVADTTSKDIRTLGKVLFSKSLLIKKIFIMPKDESPKLKGAICNIPVDVGDLCNNILRASDSNGLVIVKLKRKLQYRGYVYFKSVRPDFTFRLLQFLKVKIITYTMALYLTFQLKHLVFFISNRFVINVN